MRTPPLQLNAMRRSHAGFTLVELLSVVALMMVLLSLTMMGINGVLASTELNRAGNTVADAINVARQEAVRRNREVQVIFYELPQNGVMGWRGFQISQVEETVNGPVTREIGKMQILSPAVVISGETTLSPLLGADATISGTRNDVAAYPNTQIRFRGIRIRPGGALDKSVTPANNFLTVHRSNGAGSPPDNYYAIQINPVTGAVRTYRP